MKWQSFNQTIQVMLLVCLAPLSTLQAATITLHPSADTFVTADPDLGGPSSLHGSDDRLGVGLWVPSGPPSPPGPPYIAPLVLFDLSAYDGWTVQSDATVELYLFSSWPFQGCTQVVVLHEQENSWDEDSTNYENLPELGTPGVPYLDGQEVTLDLIGGPGQRYVSWTIPSYVVQSWIDWPAENQGLIFLSGGAPGEALWFRSKEFGANAPKLTFEAIPEPGTVVLLGLGALSLIRRKKTARLRS